MRSRLRFFALVGVLATAVDLGLFLFLTSGSRRWPVVRADVVALALAACTAYLLNRYLTFRANRAARWVSSPLTFAFLALAAGAVDLVALVVLDSLGVVLLVAKSSAILLAATVRWVGYRWVLFNTVRRERSERRPRGAMDAPLRLTVVIPAFNEAANVAVTVATLHRSFEAYLGGDPFEILVSDDGSTDTTADVAEASGARVLRLGRNRGKGAAVRAGVIDARGRSVIFTDADLAYSPEAVWRVLQELEDGWDFVVGSRRHEETTTLVRAGRLREIGGRGINWLTQLVLLGRFRDTQCGLKGFRQDIGRVVFERTVIDGFAFDVELFLIAEQDQLSVQEIPVSVANRAGSSVRIVGDTLQLARDLLRIRRRAGAGGYHPTYHQERVLTDSLSGALTDTLTTKASNRTTNDDHQKAVGAVKDLDAIVKAYDIRGTYPDQIDAPTCRALGVGFGVFVREMEPETTEIAIARDMRPSGPELVDAFADGVQSQGLDVVDLGLASTDLVYFASGSRNQPGVMFTASHNPAGYNGIKLCLSGATPVGEDSGLAAIKRTAQRSVEPQGVAEAATRGTRSSAELLDAFSDHVRSFIRLEGLRPLKVIADTANGMGGLVVPAAFEGLPFDLEVLFGELDGTFPNHPADPIQVENLASLRARVLETGADIGLAFDGDADRVFLVDEKAEPVSGSLTTALLAKAILADNPGGAVIHNLICSKVVPEVIRESGGEVIRSRVGHSFIKQIMAERNAVFGGEHSAHYYFRDNYRADSGLIASMMVLEQLSRSGGTLSELLAPLKRYEASGEINTRVSDAHRVIEHVAAHYADVDSDRLDGLTIDAGSWWFNLRPSNTEPLLRLNLEAADLAAVQARVAEVQAVMAEVG